MKIKPLSSGTIAILVRLLHPSNIVEVYSGTPGCGCGCNGTYRSSGRMVTNNIRYLQADPSKVKYGPGKDGTMCFSLETPSRYRWVYVKKAVIAAGFSTAARQ